MSYNITGTTITLTRGDTLEALVSATKKGRTQYIPVAGDTIRFAMKENYDDPRPLLVKDIPIDTMMLTLEPQDTADLNFGKYAESGLLKVAFRPLEAYKELYLYLLAEVWTVIFMRANTISFPATRFRYCRQPTNC